MDAEELQEEGSLSAERLRVEVERLKSLEESEESENVGLFG